MVRYGFLDEAGDAGRGPRASRATVVAVVLTASPQQLRREVKKVRARLGKKKKQLSEFKASRSLTAWNRKRLERLARLEIEVVVVAAEKASSARSLAPEDLYRLLTVRALDECLRRCPTLTLCVDKRHTNPLLRHAYDVYLRGAVAQPVQTLIIEHADSIQELALQQADLIAWAFLQKYTRGDESFSSLIRNRVVVETVLRGL